MTERLTKRTIPLNQRKNKSLPQKQKELWLTYWNSSKHSREKHWKFFNKRLKEYGKPGKSSTATSYCECDNGYYWNPYRCYGNTQARQCRIRCIYCANTQYAYSRSAFPRNSQTSHSGNCCRKSRRSYINSFQRKCLKNTKTSSRSFPNGNKTNLNTLRELVEGFENNTTEVIQRNARRIMNHLLKFFVFRYSQSTRPLLLAEYSKHFNRGCEHQK